MKKIAIVIVFCIAGKSSPAQSFGQMVQTMLQQIAALQAYIKTAEKGYQIVESGLHTIGDIKNGEFNLHSVFFRSLESVNPKVAGMSEVAEMIALQASMMEQFSKKLSAYRQSTWLHPGEITYINQVYDGLVKEGQEEVDALTALLTDGQLKMTDGERIRGIQTLDASMKQQSRLAQSFTNQTDLLVTQRQQEGRDIGTVKGLY